MKTVEVFKSKFKHHHIATICGSMKFYDEMIELAEFLTAKGFIVLVPFKHIEGSYGADQCKLMMHERIMMSDEIYVVNKDGYIGENTKENIEFAKSIGRHIYYTD